MCGKSHVMALNAQNQLSGHKPEGDSSWISALVHSKSDPRVEAVCSIPEQLFPQDIDLLVSLRLLARRTG